jgi:hypothetical protein
MMKSFLCPLAAAVLCLSALPPDALAFAENELPETLRSGYVAPITGPADSESYAHGKLGIVRTGFGRASLFVAYRLMQLPPRAVADEAHDRTSNAFLGRTNKPYMSGSNEIDTWLNARKAIVPTPPPQRPDFFRTTTGTLPGFAGKPGFQVTSEEGNCGPDAFEFAARTLDRLVADKKLTDADRRNWIAGQDTVFARCSWVPGTTPAPELPAELPPKTAPKLQALRAYQHASALFYSGDFDQARQEFDAIALVPAHPLRAWAALGAMRSVVRPATLDKDWEAAFNDAFHKRGLRDAALHEALTSAREKHRTLVDSAVKDVAARYKVIDSDPAFAEVKAAATYTQRRAATQLSPAVVINWTMDALDHADWNPYVGSTLDMWGEYYPRVLTDRPDDKTLAFLRGKHAFFDWIAAVQGCGDAARAPDQAICRTEHSYALAQWQATKRNDWLLAALMTAGQPDSANLPAADAVQSVARDRPEWVSLQFYAARVLRTQGRSQDALALLDRIAGAPELQIRDDKLIDAERQATGRVPAPAPAIAGSKTAVVTEQQIRAAYDRIAATQTGSEYNVRHILVDSQEKAQQLLDRLHRGEPFGQVARAVPSLDPGSATKGGELGWCAAACYDPDFAKAVLALAPRGVSAAPVKTRFGWHVIEVNDTRPKTIPPYAEVHDKLAEVLRRKAAGQ